MVTLQDFQSSLNSNDGTKSVLNLSNKFYECYEREKEKLPYHLNLIDELRANENAHSRILVKLLQYNPDNKFAVLQEFLNFIQEKNQEVFEFNHSLTNCQITEGKQYIDAFIKGEKFAIIIENKIHGAKDQENQIENYINKAKQAKIDENEIYVIYLTRDGGTPSIESFSDSQRELFKKRKRYVELSYRYDIINWLDKSDLSTVKENETFISSALHQYIDHLKGLFNIRNININMNKELLKTIQNELGLNEDYQENVKTIRLTLDKLNKTKEYLDKALLLHSHHWLNLYQERMKKDYPNNIIKCNTEEDFAIVSIVEKWNDLEFSVSIEYQVDDKETKPYFGISRHHTAADSKKAEIEKLLSDLLNNYEKSDWWYGWKRTSFEDAYKEFQQLFENVLEKITQN